MTSMVTRLAGTWLRKQEGYETDLLLKGGGLSLCTHLAEQSPETEYTRLEY